MPEWIDDLVDDISAEILTVARFKTHKQRKAFLGMIASMIKNAVDKNAGTTYQDGTFVRPSMVTITRPNPNGPKGHAVMTEDQSSKNDDVHNAVKPGFKAGMKKGPEQS